MKRNLHIDLIKHFILENSQKPFEEVEAFAEEIGASFDELEEAIYAVARDMPHRFSQQTEKNLFSLNAKIPMRSRMRGLYSTVKLRHVGFLLAAVGISTLISLRISHQDPVATLPTKETPAMLVNAVVHPEAVYATQQSIDATKVFSFPSVPVSLKYTNKPKKQVIGFFPYWMLEKQDEINIRGYTAVNIFALEVDGKGNIITARDGAVDPGWGMWQNPKLDTFLQRLKRQSVKRVIAIKAFNNTNIEHLALSDDAQEKFISNALQLMNTKGFDGINLDFEYVGTADQKVRDGFVRLVANLRNQMQKSYPRSTLSIDTYVTAGSNEGFFNVAVLQEHVDAIIIMGYDIHTPKGSAGPVAPFEGPSGIIGFMESYLQRVNPDKLVLAVPYYGYAWPVGTDANGDILSYAEISAMTKKKSVQWNSLTQTPYFLYTNDNQKYELHFDNPRSLGIKYDYVNEKGLQGVAVWAMGYEGYSQDLEIVLFDKFGKEPF